MMIDSRATLHKLFSTSTCLTGERCKSLSSTRWIFAAAVFVSILTGCGSGRNPGPIPGESTNVTLLFSSTANDQISAFQLAISSVTLTSQAGNSVTVFQQPPTPGPFQPNLEAIHTNGNAELLGTVSIPQDIYTSASVIFSGGDFTFVTFSANTISYNQDILLINSTAVPVMLASPITISGDAMTLAIDLQVSKSASFTGPPPGTFTLTPVFNVTQISVAPQPTNDQNGKTSGVHGRIASISTGGTGFSVALPDGPTLPVKADAGTVFQGINSLSALTAGMFVDMDAVIRADGAAAATRVDVADNAAHDVVVGPLTQVENAVSVVHVLVRQAQGDDISGNEGVGQGSTGYQWDANTVFMVSGQFTNLADLPFTASFTVANMVAGQNVSLSSATISGGPFIPLTTITLLPQTINGTVNGISSSGAFTVYSTTLASNELIPTLTNTSNVMAYVDGNTQIITSSPIVAGSVVRFNGLLFNDNGTLRMVSGTVRDGVAP